jgi:hypothetical protein
MGFFALFLLVLICTDLHKALIFWFGCLLMTCLWLTGAVIIYVAAACWMLLR